MSDGMLGAVPEELRSLARDMLQAAQLLQEARSGLSAKINGPLQWRGADAFFFKHAWNSSHAPTLRNAVELLTATARALNRQAAAQEAASAG